MTPQRKTKKRKRRVFGYPERPRLSISISLAHIRAQLVDDVNGKTLSYFSTESMRSAKSAGAAFKNKEMAKQVGTKVAEQALANGIKQVVFDRAQYRYHGKVQAFAEAAREAGLVF